jgi:hypothetical protein
MLKNVDNQVKVVVIKTQREKEKLHLIIPSLRSLFDTKKGFLKVGDK